MKKLLVCEDEDAIREFEVITLRRAGYEVVDASCGEDAIKYFEAVAPYTELINFFSASCLVS